MIMCALSLFKGRFDRLSAQVRAGQICPLSLSKGAFDGLSAHDHLRR